MATLAPADRFVNRHNGPSSDDIAAMLKVAGAKSLDELIDQTVPKAIRRDRPMDLPAPLAESELLEELQSLAAKNQVFKSWLGAGYSDCFVPPVVQRNILENPGWYTAYTPYQAEIAQGRLEALLNFQTMVMDLTGLEIANASLLDEGTAAAEAMSMCFGLHEHDTHQSFFVDERCHPQTIEVVRTRAKPLGIEVVVGRHETLDPSKKKLFGALVQSPDTLGTIHDLKPFAEKIHAAGALLVVAADPLALTLMTPPAEMGADVAIGSTQRFGVPLGYGGPHAAYFATRQSFARSMPGRLIGVSEDAQGKPALRMALQTREQHIRREKATSNICTAQVLLAVMASMYAVWHGPKGLTAIAERVHACAAALAKGLGKVASGPFFDTVVAEGVKADDVIAKAAAKRINLRKVDASRVAISFDETTTAADVDALLAVFGKSGARAADLARDVSRAWPVAVTRKSAFLGHPVFNTHHSETEMQRYIRSLEAKDLSLTHSMIPLGSCTMKLNAASEMLALTWPGWARMHPHAPAEQAAGYRTIFERLERWLADITGLSAVSLQPNAGSQGEYAGLLVIRRWHEARGQGARDVCLIPQSAHGTNPASAVMAGFKVVVVKTDDAGNIDVGDLEKKAAEHAPKLAALMVTYPSTHGVFEEEIRRICEIVHGHGGQVYMDGANMNAMVGVSGPGWIGADVCHLNLHKTFCIPHGGGGPGMGPIAVAKHLAEFLPGAKQGIGMVSAADHGSALILLISYAYIAMMGAEGLTDATRIAILNANYIAKRLQKDYPVLYQGKNGRIAHECILDMRSLKKSAGVEVEDIAKRLMDYGFHAPTVSFPVASTMMVEPTESEPKEELDRFCEAMTAIRDEIREVEKGTQPKEGNVLKNAPHTAEVVTADEWTRPYPRTKAAFPLAWVKKHKFWPSVGRVNNAFGDRNLVCSCPPIESYSR